MMKRYPSNRACEAKTQNNTLHFILTKIALLLQQNLKGYLTAMGQDKITKSLSAWNMESKGYIIHLLQSLI